MGTLMCGAGHVWAGRANFYPHHRTNFHKLRRLHLVVVDLWRPWKYNTARVREITDQLWLIQDCEDARVSPFVDGPDFPCYSIQWAAKRWAVVCSP